MFSLNPDFDQALGEAEKATLGAPARWLDEDNVPTGVHRLARSVRLPDGTSMTECADALFSWAIHRGAGLRVTANGRAAVGSSVVLGQRLGPVWAVAPCRVVDVVSTDREAGFTYAALPGHPEEGAERFAVVREPDGTGLRFDVSAVSRHAFWGSRLVPVIAGRMQAAITQRYLDSASGRGR